MAIDEISIAHVVDRLVIEAVLVLYATLIDTKQFDRLREVFSADAVVNYTSAGGIKGSLAEVSAWLAKVLTPFTVVQHLVANFAIEIDGDRARSVCYFHNPMRLSGPDGTISMFWCGGRYLDELVRTSEGWLAHLRSHRRGAVHARWSRLSAVATAGAARNVRV
jgi:hypothetical protein